MHHYPHNIGDFDKATRHLTRIERSIYRDLIELYYDTEQMLTLDTVGLCRLVLARTNEESTAVEQALNEFFIKTPNGWYHQRCEFEIEKYKANSSQQAKAGKASAAARALKAQQALDGNSTAVEQALNAGSTGEQPNGNGERGNGNGETGTGNQAPDVITTKEDLKVVAKKEKTARAARLPADWVLPKHFGEWALEEKPLLADDDIRKIGENFKDHWISSSGKNATKLDWFAAWRIWVRKEPDAPRKNGIMTAQQQRDLNNKKSSDEFVSGITGEKGRVFDHE
jgi:uncharacterized protein YdaU (DUF1376 family)